MTEPRALTEAAAQIFRCHIQQTSRSSFNGATATLDWIADRDKLLSPFFLYLCTPTIVIDGVATRRPWGTHDFQVPPGMHNVRIYFGYLFMSTCGDNQLNVVVQPNCIHRVKFEMGMFMFSPGAIRELPPYRFE